MKKLLFVFMAVGLIASASSCKKCGHCSYTTTSPGSNSSATCKNNTMGGLLDEYKQAEADCIADGDTWVVQ